MIAALERTKFAFILNRDAEQNLKRKPFLLAFDIRNAAEWVIG